ncbi:MAG: hypothetical protein J1F11_05475 [Oscillospiraceae bacterium]|nr:hypothetical protein [Oscillospiraceae bacterium]
MDIIKESIKQWLTHYGIVGETDQNIRYYGFIKEYEEYYKTDINTMGEQITAEDIKNAASHGFFSSVEVFPECIYLYTNAITRKIYDEKLNISYKVHVKGNEFTFTLIVENNDLNFNAPINDILNEYLGSIRFTRGLIIHNSDELKKVFQSMCIESNYLRHYIVDMSCAEYYDFLIKTDFLKEYEYLNISCNRNNTGFKSDKKSIMSLLKQYDGFSVKYCSSDRFYEIKKSIGEVEIGYNVEIRYKFLINFIIWGRRNNKPIFAEPSVDILVKNHGSGNKLCSLQFHSIDELKNIFDFMLKYLDILASFF